MASRWVRESSEADQLTAAAKSLLLHLGVHYDDATVDTDLTEAPNYPTLYSLEAALLRWGVSSAVIQVDVKDLASLPVPCVALDRIGRCFVVTALEPERGAQVIDTRSGPAKLDWQALSARWGGVAVAAERNEGASASSPAGQAAARARTLRTLAVAGLGVVTAAALVGLLGARRLPLLVCDAVGLAVSVMLLHADSGGDSFVRRFCSLGRRLSCSNVLQSSAARIGPVSMTDIGLIYFSGSLLVQLETTLAAADAAALGWARAALALAAVPYTLFSLGYQAKLGVFCPLCVAVQLLLWIEAALLGATALRPELLGGHSTLLLVLAWAAPTLAWGLFRPLVLAGLRQPATDRALRRVSRDPARIAALLEASPVCELGEAPLEIVDGDPNAATVIIAYTDLLCHVCKDTHAELGALVARGGLQVRYRPFSYFPQDGRSIEMTGRLCDLVAAGAGDAARDALESWYTHGHLAAAPGARSEASLALEARQQAWASSRSFDSAPVLYLGDRLLPPHILVPDLLYFIDSRAAANDDESSSQQSA